MPRRTVIRLSLLVIAGGCSTPSGSGADLVLRGGAVYTVDSIQPSAEAVAVRGGRIVFVGSNADVDRFVGRGTRVYELAGRMLLPGFIDTHAHPVTSGIELGECALSNDSTLEALTLTITECARSVGDSAWVRGGGFQLPLFANGSPSRTLLDSLVGNRPAYLTSADGHSAWVNSRALGMAGVGRDTRDPPKGRIERDARGNPSGTLRESAMGLVSRHLAEHAAGDYSAGLDRALTMAARLGITTWHEASAREEIAQAYASADSSGRLTVRTIVSFTVNTDRGPEQVLRLDSLRARYRRPNVHPVAAKIFLDGVIEGQTAALLAPYLDRRGYSGELNASPEQMNALVHALDSAGFKVHVHAIGDRAIRVAFDAFEKQRALDAGAGPKHVMAHIQLFAPEDIGRFQSLGVVASFQPLWAYRDSYIKDLTEPRLGPERSRWLYPIASVVKTGAMVAGGSDWSVSSMNPLEAIQVAVTRRALDDSTGAAWLPDQRVDLPTMLRAYTMGGAVASELDSLVGSIRVGKAADLIVLSENLLETPVHRIGKARVVMTVFNGREVFRDSTVVR
jgi:predicted amidohydrolase YtcJ